MNKTDVTKFLIELKNDAETMQLGQRLAHLCGEGDVIALWGDLGAGKSTLARALIRELAGADIDVPSPTFTLLLTYDLANLPVWHFDLYRLEESSELRELGFEDSAEGLAIIEWPERMGDALPQYRLDVELTITSTGRTAHLVAHGPDWSRRLAAFK